MARMKYGDLFSRWRPLIRRRSPAPRGFLLVALAAAIVPAEASPASFGAPLARTQAQSPAIVIGMVGGYVRRDDRVHSVVQVADRLRREYATGVYVAVFENHQREQAHQEILRLLDADRTRALSAAEKRGARIILYGHSWGASETVTLARELEKDGIPVLLTIQVDSVAKPGQDDGLIPPNVLQAVNFFQVDGYLHGRREIRASDPSRTEILGNYRSGYKAHPLACPGYPWYAWMFMRAHTEIECDPAVWTRVESLIRSKLAAPGWETRSQ